jgi:hypothetical protein
MSKLSFRVRNPGSRIEKRRRSAVQSAVEIAVCLVLCAVLAALICFVGIHYAMIIAGPV